MSGQLRLQAGSPVLTLQRRCPASLHSSLLFIVPLCECMRVEAADSFELQADSHHVTLFRAASASAATRHALTVQEAVQEGHYSLARRRPRGRAELEARSDSRHRLWGASPIALRGAGTRRAMSSEGAEGGRQGSSHGLTEAWSSELEPVTEQSEQVQGRSEPALPAPQPASAESGARALPDSVLLFLMVVTDGLSNEPAKRARPSRASNRRDTAAAKKPVRPTRARTAEARATRARNAKALAAEAGAVEARATKAAKALSAKAKAKTAEKAKKKASVAARTRRQPKAKVLTAQRPQRLKSVPQDGSIAAAYELYELVRARRYRLRAAGASEERLAAADLAVKRALDEMQARRDDPVNAAELERLSSSRRGRYSLKARHDLPAHDKVIDAKTGAAYAVWNTSGDDNSIFAAHNLHNRAQRTSTKARRAGACAEVLATLEQAVQVSKELYSQRFRDPRNAEEAEQIRARRSAGVLRQPVLPLPPDDGSIMAAIRLYQREQRNKRSMIVEGKEEDEVARVATSLREARELACSRFLDPANAEEKEQLPTSYHKLFGRKPRGLRASSKLCQTTGKRAKAEHSLTDPRDGTSYQLWSWTGDGHSLRATQRVRDRAYGVWRRANLAGASEEVLVTLEQAYQRGKELYLQRLRDPRNVVDAEAARLTNRTNYRRNKVDEDGNRKSVLPVIRREIEPDDGSVHSAHRMYSRAIARRTELRHAKASEEVLAQADEDVRQTRHTAYLRYSDPATEEERKMLPFLSRYARPYREEVEGAAYRKKGSAYRSAADDGSISAAWNAHATSVRRIRNARKAGAAAEELEELEMAAKKTHAEYSARLADPRNAAELDQIRARNRKYFHSKKERTSTDSPTDDA